MHPFLPPSQGLSLHMTQGLYGAVWQSTQGHEAVTPPQAQRRGLGNLRCPGSREAAQPWPHKPSFLGRGVGTGLRRGEASTLLCRDHQALQKGAKDLLCPCLALAPPEATGKWPWSGVHHGKLPFPATCTPCFQLLNMGTADLSL